MKNNIILIILALFITTLVLGCFEYRRDRDHRERYDGERHDNERGVEVRIR